MKLLTNYIALILISNLVSIEIYSQNDELKFDFEGNTKSENHQFIGNDFSYEQGIDGQALSLKPTNNEFNNLKLDNLSFDGSTSFSVQFWVKLNSKKPTVLISQKEFLDKGLNSQKNKGWALFSSGGTLGWTIGSGKRRLNYERDNGDKLKLSDKTWHLITMTYNKASSETRLYFDGKNIAIYKVGFDFFNKNPIVIGTQKNDFDYENEFLPDIVKGAKQLQNLVNEFNNLDVEDVKEDEFFNLIVDFKELYLRKLNIEESERSKLRNQELPILEKINKVQDSLYYNAYTVSQNHELTALKPVSKIYYLKNGVVHINDFYAKQFGATERLYPSNFSIDKLTFSKQSLSFEEVWNSYNKYKPIKSKVLENKLDTLTVAVWNIWHGGKHFTINENGWDSRLRIAEMLKNKNADIILMQETYSSGDFIAAELGYYFATTSDWDYCHQGSNISVMSRYPIKELEVSDETEFMNISVKIALSETQEIYAMSNWYGMSAFPKVYDFQKEKFIEADKIPILFGGDFNAIPHTDGGDSEASIKMLENGFIDAFRYLHRNAKMFPGYTHQWGERIDQLYFKGKGLEVISSEVVSTASEGFPSDHFMILSTFKLN